MNQSMTSFMHRIINDETFTPATVGSVLDVGCGRGVLGCLLRIYRKPVKLVGIDIFDPYIQFCEAMNAYDEIVRYDLVQGIPFPDKSFDQVYCLEMVEHMKWSDAIKLLESLKRVGKRVVVTTPTHYFRSEPLDSNDHQLHRCQVYKRDFENLGYRVRGIGPLKHTNIHSWRLSSLLPTRHQNLVATWVTER